MKVRRAMKNARSKFAKRMAPTAKQATRQYGDEDKGHLWKTNQLYFRYIQFPRNDATAEVYQRLGPTIHLRGMNLCEYMYNGYDYPVEIHTALLQAKENTMETMTDIEVDFFRDTANASKRAADFPSGVWDIKLTCGKINPDKWHIIMHQRKILDPKSKIGNTNELNNGRWLWKYNKYFKLNRRLNFSGPSATTPTAPLIVVQWAQAVHPANFQATPPVVLRSERMSQIYFKNGFH